MFTSPQRVRQEIPLAWFGQTLWKYTPLYMELVFLAVCLRLIGLVQPFIFQVVIDRILPFQRESSLVVVILIFIGASLFQMGFSILSDVLGALTANRVIGKLGSRIYDHLFRLPYSYFRRCSVGETMARIGETETIHHFLVGTTTGVVLDLLFVVIYVGILLILSNTLTLVVLIALPLQGLIYLAFGPFLRRRLRAQFDAGAAHQAQMVENISGSAAVKALSAEPAMLERLDRTLHRVLETGYRVRTLNIASRELVFLCERAVTIGIVYFGAQLVFAGSLTLGQLIAFQLIADKVAGPVAGFAGLWESWQNIKVSRQRLGDIVATPTEPFGALPLLANDLEPRLTFSDVGFSYVPGSPILDRFCFEAQPFTCTLVVGPSGSGKSTFGRLASGIETPSEGTVLFGGEDISAYDPHDVRSRIAYVPQEPYLFSGTLRENLLLRSRDASEAQLRRALEIAAADRLVAQLPQGLDTQVGERGASLSGGQRQRVAIARSILMDPDILILDEPTSALDEDAQRKMVAELMALKDRLTLIVITHRPDMFAEADQIVDFGMPEKTA